MNPKMIKSIRFIDPAVPVTKESLLEMAKLGPVTVTRFDRELEETVTDQITADMPLEEICL